jgi:hypothetical protein
MADMMFNHNIEPIASLGPYFLAREGVFAMSEDWAHECTTMNFLAADLEHLVPTKLVDRDQDRELWLAGMNLLRSQHKGVLEERDIEQADVAEILPIIGQDGTFQFRYQFTSSCSYAASDGQWSGYTVSSHLDWPSAPQLLDAWRVPPKAVRAFWRTNSPPPAAGWSEMSLSLSSSATVRSIFAEKPARRAQEGATNLGEFASLAILTGAGLSRNWDGYLASEFWQLLVGHTQIASDEKLSQLVHEETNFEVALDRIRAEDTFSEHARWTFSRAVIDVFKQHDESIRVSPFNSPSGIDLYRFREFFGQFLDLRHANTGYIFTLNQDLLLERKLYRDSPWQVPVLPGIPTNPKWFGPNFLRLQEEDIRQIPRGLESPPVLRGSLNYLKLHGSADWRLEGGGDILVMGGGKSGTIARYPLLAWYQSIFRAVCCSGDTRLMVLGYSFSDEHINGVLAEGVLEHRLRLFVWDVLSPQELKKSIEAKPHGIDIWKGINGGCSRPMKDVIPGSQTQTAEYNRIVREFFRRGQP